jgi:hypothetical protein
MSSRPHSRAVALVLSLVPGWGHAYWGKEGVGLAVFTGFAIVLSGLLNGLFIYLGDGRGTLVAVSASLLLAITAGAWFDILRRTSPEAVRTAAEDRERSLREGTVAYLRGDLAGASALFKGCVGADPSDVEALFRLGVVTSRAGDARAARVWLRRALKCDLEDKWRWEICRELERSKEEGARAARAAPARGGAHQATKEAEPHSV